MIDVSTRLRRAIHLNDLALVQRIVRTHPGCITNPDYADKSHTSLHLAARQGSVGITAFLIEAGHEDGSVSINTEWDTPLMLAVKARQVDVGRLLVLRFPGCVVRKNRGGMDALMLAARHGALPLLSLMLTSDPPADPTEHDLDGNTALHHASAAGELKALRVLLQHGASPRALNNYSWTPIAYSATHAAEAYFKQLVDEFEKKRVEAVQNGLVAGKEGRVRQGGVRLVTSEEGWEGRRREGSLGQSEAPMGGLEWSPVERRAVTPTGENGMWGSYGGRGRASSGE
ncbi:ankyrin [Trichodelitschia bisporula]|uniref:Ankyrin n=1 Tax=Trichodelitschia bisporula TaxID=703511 RepID=A0A6G1I1X2_9PEZI|nr:ankyrin [Trichodelitschia bisporula]